MFKPIAGTRRQRMQDIDRPAEIEALAEPARARRARVQAEPLNIVLGSKDLDRMFGHCRRRRDIWQDTPVWTPELKRVVGLSIDPIALLVDRAVVPATQQREIRERRRAAFGPVTHVKPLAERQPAS